MSSAGLSFTPPRGNAAAMDKKPEASSRPQAQSREDRLAAKLRENLKRRKAQARMLEPGENGALPKSPPKS
jgi:hypothetical protein